jgi:hypothetical protein
MPEIKTEFLFTIALEVEVLNLGDTPYGSRRVGRFGTGSFEGPKLRGTVLPGGACSMLLRRDDALEIEVRITLETDDQHDQQQIYMSWKGFRHGPKEVIDRLNRGEIVDPETYYFRTTPYFETSSEKYDWMNRICSIAPGSRKAVAGPSKFFRCCSRWLMAAYGTPPSPGRRPPGPLIEVRQLAKKAECNTAGRRSLGD